MAEFSFLSRLIARGRGEAPAVQPLLPPLFAPPNLDGEQFSATPFFLQETGEFEDSRFGRPDNFSPAVPYPVEDRAVPLSHWENSLETWESGRQTVSTSTVPELEFLRPETPLKTEERPLSFRDRDEIPFFKPENSLPLPTPEVAATPPPGILYSGAGEPTVLTSVKKDFPDLFPETPVGIGESFSRKPELKPSASLPAHSGRYQRELPATPEPPPAPPSINININRVEVRAIQASPAPAKNPVQKSAPKISLDDYLRSQSGGKR